MEEDLQGRVAVVSGSSRGIGAAIATLFANHGAEVVVHGRDAPAVGAVVSQIERTGRKAIGIAADLTRYVEIEQMREKVESRLGPVELLVANAGGSTVPPAPIEEISESDWRGSIDGNLTATFLTIKAFLPGMKERGRGNIITISSAAARRPSGRSPLAYAAAKAAIELMSKQLAVQVGPDGIRVNCIAPETILTERNERLIPDDIREQLRITHPIRRLGLPDDVAEAALFLASERSGWISGVTLDVAGGSVV
jgi:3-oxoacyl-[acyl-carrier protein] reductase